MTDTAHLADPVRDALRAGWEVANPEGPRAVVTCPNGARVYVPTTEGQAALLHARSRLDRHGLTDALADLDPARERSRSRVLDRRAATEATEAERATRAARQRADQAEAARRAAGPYLTAPDDSVTVADLLTPHPAPRVYRVLVTPAMAGKLLEANTRNRKLSPAEVDADADEIGSGRWGLTHQGIAFDTTGRLVDGQHRLSAIVQADRPAESFVWVGMPVDSFALVDAQRKRTAADVLHIDGWTTSTGHTGTALRLLRQYIGGAGSGTFRRTRVANTVIRDMTRELPADQVAEAVRLGDRMRTGSGITPSAGACAALVLWRACGRDNPLVERFFDPLVTGAIPSTDDPRLRLVRNVRNARKTGEGRRSHEQLAYLVKTWNAWITGRTLKTLAWKSTEAMPVPFVPPSDWTEPAGGAALVIPSDSAG